MRADKKRLLDYLIRTKILKTESVIKAFEQVPREKFIPADLDRCAYVDEPLPLFEGQTISQPYTVAFMTEALEPKAGQKVLEIGTGSGYQAALLSRIVKKVVTIERLESLYDFARKNLKSYKNIKVICADGSRGYKKAAPYDRIIVTCAAPEIPKPLFEQLKEKGIMILPIGASTFNQKLVRVRKIRGKKEEEYLGPFVFVPLVGKFGF